MKRLSKTQVKERDDHNSAIEKAKEELEAAIDEFNTKVGELWAELIEPKKEAAIEVINEAESFRQEIESDMEGYISERSDRWQESDAGSTYNDWYAQWQGALDAGEIESLEEPENIEMPDFPEFEEGEYPDEPGF